MKKLRLEKLKKEKNEKQYFLKKKKKIKNYK